METYVHSKKKKRPRRGGARFYRRSRALGLFLIVFVLSGSVFLVSRHLGLAGDCSMGAENIQSAFSQVPPTPVALPVDQVYSANALLVRLNDRSVLYTKADAARTYPASLTKMMTVITFLENYRKEGETAAQQLNRLQSETFIMPASIYPILEERHASMAGLKPGETVTYENLLYACHLPSGADGSMGLAFSLTGSEKAFVDLMNAKAAELGMKDTHFANVTGLHDPAHYTTADDMGLLLAHGLKNQLFRTIFTATEYEIPANTHHPEGMILQSTLSYKMQDPQANRTTVLGGKTGYTEEAGLCLASLAQKGSQEYILITMGAPGNNHSEQFNITDATKIYGAL